MLETRRIRAGVGRAWGAQKRTPGVVCQGRCGCGKGAGNARLTASELGVHSVSEIAAPWRVVGVGLGWKGRAGLHPAGRSVVSGRQELVGGVVVL